MCECLGGLEVDDELDFYSLLDGKIGRLLAFENAPGIETSLVVAIEESGAISHQAACEGELAV